MEDKIFVYYTIFNKTYTKKNMRQKNLVKRIREDVISKKVKEPFRAIHFPYLEKSRSFISKHAVGNGKYKEYFERVGYGSYKLKK